MTDPAPTDTGSTDTGSTDTGSIRPGVVWFRRDLRLEENPAWAQAAAGHSPVVGLFVLDPVLLGGAGPERRDLLFAHLAALDRELAGLGGRLVVRTAADPTGVAPGGTEAVAAAVARVVDELAAAAVHANRDAAPYATRRDRATAAALAARDARLVLHDGNTVHPPGSVRTVKGTLSRVFTPFHRVWERLATDVAAVELPHAPTFGMIPSEPVPRPVADVGREVGPEAGWRRLGRWAEQVDDYDTTRDLPAVEGTSTLSVDLKFGALSPRTVLDVIGTASQARQAFVRQLAWRDWWFHLLLEEPTLAHHAIKADYDRISWRDDPAGFEAWCSGFTGYPIVDAGMRQLNQTGWMHNRVRMITASFLVKDLLVDWRLGERYFRRRLLDADLAQNAGNWQWVAGTGPDAAPYFRVFNPVGQARRFDPDGAYVRRWVPELAGLAGPSIHEPWKRGPLELAAAGIILGADYPAPIVDHQAARTRTLEAYRQALGR